MAIFLSLQVARLTVLRSALYQAMYLLLRRHIDRVIRLTGGNKSAAARLLGIDRRTLQRKGH